ncbi:MAG: hypothetical protein L3J01_04145 [Thiomicrorhabdus sp.]|nr:hypothetical protein [Thiomicrorhabdus sp.]
MEFLQGRLWLPKEYGIKIDGNALGAEKLKILIELHAENISLIKALSLIADMFQAKLVIGAGIVTLKPDAKPAEQNAAEQPASRPAVTNK